MSVELSGLQIVDKLRGKQVRLLLAYLLLHRARQVPREELMDAMWPHSAPRSQDAAMRTLLSRLRAAVGNGILTGRDDLGLALPEPVWVDFEAARTEVGRALSALEEGDLRAAWALAQVPLNVASRGLLPGAEANWLEAPRRELTDLRLQALELIGRAGLGLGGSQLASAERAARALIELEPYRESAYVLLMEALAAQGNLAEGLRVFEQLRTLLRDEFGTPPSPEALASHERLLNPASRPAQSARTERATSPIGLPGELASWGTTPLVGRAHELEELERLWGWTCTGGGADPPAHSGAGGAGRARIVVLAGDSGVGKTRLSAELARRVHERGAVVLAGRAPEESLVPYQPFLEALRHYVVAASLEDLRVSAREYGEELARLVPELRRRLPELPPAQGPEPDTERYRMFEAVVGLLSAIAARAPVLLVLDDLHWADRATLLLLRHLARAGDPRRLLILVAYRATEQGLDELVHFLADQRRENLLAELRIGGLSEEQTAALVGVLTSEEPAPAFARALHEETEGNPLFIRVILRHLLDAGVRPASATAADLERVGVPDGVKHVIARRLAELEAPAVEWLRLAAVIGRDFEAPLLERVWDRSEEEFLDILERALANGLVLERGGEGERFSFSHGLIRETLYEGMSSPRRARTHLRVARALESLDAEPQLSALAYHYTCAASPAEAAKAIGFGHAAGDRAMAMLAYEEAAEHYARAREVCDRFHPDDLQTRCRLLLAQGEAQVRTGDPGLAREALHEAAELAERLQDGEAIARAAIAASRRYLQQPGLVDHDLIGWLERALELTAEPSALRVLLLARLCGALYFSPDRGRMETLSQEAMEIAQMLGDPEALANACAARRRALWSPGRLEERLAASTQMLMLSRQVANLEQQLQAHAWLVVDLLEHGDSQGVDAQIEAFTAGAARLRQPVFVWHAKVWQAMRAMLSGQLEQADRLAAEALEAGASAESEAAAQYYAIQLMAIRREQGRMAELEPAARAFVLEHPDRPGWEAALANLLVHAGHVDEAAERLERLGAAGFNDIPLDGDWMTTVVVLTQTTAELQDEARAELLYGLLAPYADQHAVAGLGAVHLGSVARYLGLLAAVTGREAEAARHFERALEANARMGARIEYAHTQLDYAELLGSAPRAARLATAAAKTAAEFELPLVARRAAALVPA